MNNLRKDLSLVHIVAMAAGGMIAAWMVEIKYWFELSGPGSFWALIVCGVFVLPLCLVYSELNSMLPFAGGENIWISNAFSWDVGWYFGWVLYLLYVLAMPTVAYGIATMSAYFYPLSFMQIKIFALITLIGWYFLTNLRIKFLGDIQNAMFWIMIAVSLCVSVNFLLSDNWSYATLKPWFPSGFPGFGAAVGLLIMKFVGFDMIPQLSEEINFPRKHLWKAYVASLGLTALIYGLAIIGVGGIVTTEWVAQIDIVDPRVADIIGKHYLAIAVVIVGVLSILTTLSGFWLSASRTLYGAANQRQLSAIFAKINKHGQPWIANIAVGLFAIYFTVFAPDDWLNYIYTLYGFAAGVVYLMVSLSFLRLRKKQPEWNRPYKAPWGISMGVVSVLFTVWVIYSSLSAMTATSFYILAGFFATGACFHLYAKHMQKTKPEEWAPRVLSAVDADVVA
ncbi:MAG: putative amino acid permease, GabP family [Firmicutes bacterium]|nr:putative amino acid permease, GabP family [Bacillota bacterium]MDI6707204.1 APC family permease [Bacillota bacterium]